MDLSWGAEVSYFPERPPNGSGRGKSPDRWLELRIATLSSAAVLAVLATSLGSAPAVAVSGGDQNRIWTPPNTPLSKTASVPGVADHPKSSAPATGSPNWAPPKSVPQPKSGSAVVGLVPGGAKQAGDLPVWLQPAGGGAGAAVRVQVVAPGGDAAKGSPGTVVALSGADATAGGGRVQVGLDLGAIGAGAEFAHRAGLVSLPECALTTPEADGCQERKPVASRYDEQAKRLVAEVELPATAAAGRQKGAWSESAAAAESLAAPGRVLLALDAAPSSGTGTYSATPLSASQKWTAGTSSGSFTYSYPIATPPSLGGSAPSLALGYDSASVDGKTASTNAQASWVGDGWDLSAGFVERGYRGCDKAGIPGSGDQCWGGPNLTLSLGGHAGEVVPDDASCVGGAATDEQSRCKWRLKGDDGTKVEFLTGADNGTWNGSYLKVTDTAGTVFYFGLNRLPAADGSPSKVGPESRSAWTVPVYSPNVGDPCYDGSKGKGSWCQMAWRWNLDYVVDAHGNLTTYSYTPETNSYSRGGGQNGGRGTNTSYVRGGVLASVAYGQLLSDQLGAGGAYQAAARVDFDSGERCVSDAAICDPA
ncbi:hypothetical protein AB0O91_41145, partial [Kitasatospora sp. NPDC089797]